MDTRTRQLKERNYHRDSIHERRLKCGKMAGAAGFEPATLGFGDRCSTSLSYAPAKLDWHGIARTELRLLRNIFAQLRHRTAYQTPQPQRRPSPSERESRCPSWLQLYYVRASLVQPSDEDRPSATRLRDRSSCHAALYHLILNLFGGMSGCPARSDFSVSMGFAVSYKLSEFFYISYGRMSLSSLDGSVRLLNINMKLIA